jgi:(2Fe-2S) ferredoxin
MSDAPSQAPYARHIFICTGPYCDPEGKSADIYRALARKLGELGRYDNPVRVKRGTTPCLGVCYNGPLLVVYPDGVWYHHVDEAVLDRIIHEHLHENRPVEEYIFHRLDESTCPCQSPPAIDDESERDPVAFRLFPAER